MIDWVKFDDRDRGSTKCRLTLNLAIRIGTIKQENVLIAHRVQLATMAPNVSVNFMSLVSSCTGLQKEPQTAHSVSFTWASHIATSVHHRM